MTEAPVLDDVAGRLHLAVRAGDGPVEHAERAARPDIRLGFALCNGLDQGEDVTASKRYYERFRR